MTEILMTGGRTAALPSDLVRELGLQMSDLVIGGHAQLAQADTVREQLERCDPLGRRGEVERFVQNFDDEVTDGLRREFAISVHPVQVASKLWLIDELGRHCDLSSSSPVMLGAWYGILPLIMNWRLSPPPRHMVCIDSDRTVCEAGARMIGSLYANIEYRCADAMKLDYEALHTRHFPIVVNTICEHLADPAEWLARIPARQLVVLQNNNYTACPDHISCVHTMEEFRRQCPLSEILFEGSLRFPELERFMMIGRR